MKYESTTISLILAVSCKYLCWQKSYLIIFNDSLRQCWYCGYSMSVCLKELA